MELPENLQEKCVYGVYTQQKTSDSGFILHQDCSNYIY